ncbi:hypothetical protein [Algoriphagus sp. Y33]|uniref:hypothetical protein n=1 Tax=Algoriphagus sp. Y33 TaxID=2772483 RepID=UPI001780B0A1|nr:hypothetical protein [Algoriphagus sp. Y33]
MKKGHNKTIEGKALKRKAFTENISLKARRKSLSDKSIKYSDGVVRIYKREEEDINRFAAFARTLMPR